ncbi:MAG: hypothetical protein JSW59_08625 [Phycisphaerales bacterium]|nr:MAG: hypothetical protein JSW59_08625 [Phycisphaerales bacterium]
MFVFFPYRVDVPHEHRPVINWLFVAAVIFVFCLHIGGFVTGVGLALLLLKTGRISVERHEKSILDLLGLGRKKSAPTLSRGDRTRWQRKWEIDERAKAVHKTPPVKAEKRPGEFIHFKCSCGQTIKVSARHAGRTGRCPKCSGQVKVPQA